MINDERPFIFIIETREETKASEVYVGFSAINKNVIEWVRLIEEKPEMEGKGKISYEIYTVKEKEEL